MKVKHISALLAAALTLAACSKSEIQYESPSDICFAPASKNITKAAMNGGKLDTSVDLAVWAFWNYDQTNPSANISSGGTIDQSNPYSASQYEYLSKNRFTHKGNDQWGGGSKNGVNYVYPWPANGSLVFAGFTIPSNDYIDVTYSLNGSDLDDTTDDDVMTFTDYTQNVSNGILTSDDLCWFSATTESYNYRTAASGAVSVTLNHALTWITFKAYGSGAPVISGKEWVITSITLKNISTVGTATCHGATANWAPVCSTSSIKVYSKDVENGYRLTTLPTGGGTLPAIENVENNTLVIPQVPVMAEITYKTSPNSAPVTKTINLTLDNTKDQNGNANTKITEWEAGKHYTYTLHFKSNEIRVTPSYGEWTSTDQSITVE